MTILETEIDVRVGTLADAHYEALGYMIPRRIDARGRSAVPKGTSIRVKVSELPLSSSVRLTKVCDVCGGPTREQTYVDILRQRDNGVDSCRSCATTLHSNKRALRGAKSGNNLANKNPEASLLWHPTLNGTLIPSEVTPKSNKRVWWLCAEPGCGHEWEAPVYRVVNGSRCPVCNMSRGERRIREYIRFLGYGFSHIKEYEGLTGVGGGLLSYDFVVTYPTGDCALLIEFDGEQHEVAVEHFGGERKLKRQREHDSRKTAYARLHRIPLLRIKHTEFDDIERKINVALASIIRGDRIAC